MIFFFFFFKGAFVTLCEAIGMHDQRIYIELGCFLKLIVRSIFGVYEILLEAVVKYLNDRYVVASV